METTLDLKELIMLFLHKWFVLAGSCLFGAALVFAATKFMVTPQYTSKVSLYVNNTSESAMTTAVNINDITASQKLVNTYIVILQNDEVMQQAVNLLLKEYDIDVLAKALYGEDAKDIKVIKPESLRSHIKMSAINNTEVLEISAETADPVLSAKICTIMTEVAPPVLTRVVKAGSVEVIGSAKPNNAPSSPNVMQNTVIGFLLGGIIAGMLILIFYMMDNRVKGEDDITRRYNIPILGEVPDFASQTKEGHGYYGKSKKSN